MPITANVTNQQITASVGETQIDVSVGGGVGPTGSSGTVAVAAPITNSGTSTAAVIGLSVGAGLSTAGGTLGVSYGTVAGTACQGNDARLSDARTPLSHTHTASQITDFTTAVIAAAPPTTNASLLTSGTLAADRLPSASANTRGAVRIGTGVTIDGDGVISVSIPSLDWASITDRPSTFPPDLHAASHLPNGADELFDQSLDTTDSVQFDAVTLNELRSDTSVLYFNADWSGNPNAEFGLFVYDGETLANNVILGARDEEGGYGFIQVGSGGLHVEQSGGSLGPLICASIAFPDESVQTTAFTGLPTASGSVAGVVKIGTGVTITDGVISVSTDYAASSHAHGNITSAGAIGTTSGQIVVTTTGGALTTSSTIASSAVSGLGGAATLNVGTTAGTVAAGDHTHAQLHDRSHAITSASDHTATAWRLFHSNGSGQVVELAFGNSGQALISNGASAAPSWGQAGSTSASDLSQGTLANERLTARARAAINTFNWSSFR